MNNLSLYEMDEDGLLSIFPAEIWKRGILSKLRDSPQSLRNCANASPYFEQLLQDQRIIFLFPEVVDILAVRNEWKKFAVFGGIRADEDIQNQMDKMDSQSAAKGFVEGENLEGFESDDDNDSDHAESDTESDEDEIDDDEKEKNEWRDTMFNCRLVCSSWNKSIEACYQQTKMTGIHEYIQDHDADPTSPINLMDVEPWAKSKIEGPWKPQEFLDQFEQSHYWTNPKNPFPGRFLWLRLYRQDNHLDEDEQREERLEYFLAVSKILSYFGKEVLYLELDLENLNLEDDESYLKVKEWLDLMPNLKYINLAEGPNHFMAVSKEMIGGNPLPKLKSLEMINADIHGDLVSELIRRNGHVSQINFHEKQTLEENIGKLLINLKSLTCQISCSDENLIRKFVTHWNQLEKIRMHREDFGKASMEACKLFKILETNWANTLTNLDVGFPFSMDQDALLEESKNLRLNLPRVRKLSVTIEEYRFCFLDFILPLATNLEHLELTMNGQERASPALMRRLMEEQIVEFIGFEERMEESNIWKIFGKLKTINMEGFDPSDRHGRWMFRVYTRAEQKIVYRNVYKIW